MKYEEYEDIYDYEEEDFDVIYDDNEVYEEVYDQDGEAVYCPTCTNEIKWKEGLYICPECLWTMDLETFANYIGVDLRNYKYKFN